MFLLDGFGFLMFGCSFVSFRFRVCGVMCCVFALVLFMCVFMFMVFKFCVYVYVYVWEHVVVLCYGMFRSVVLFGVDVCKYVCCCVSLLRVLMCVCCTGVWC